MDSAARITGEFEASRSKGQGGGLNEAQIIERIYAAVLEQRLPPGTKLSEGALCEAFQVSRMRIRRVLLVLASRDIVRLEANRGAYVAKPSAAEARSIFEARRTIEPAILKNVVERITKDEIDGLERHMDAEQEAHRLKNRRDAIRLSGEFHTKLAHIAGNAVLERFIKELIARTSLIIGLYGTPGMPNCSEEEHRALLAALRNGDHERAENLMLQHLHDIEQDLDLLGRDQKAPDIRDIFAG